MNIVFFAHPDLLGSQSMPRFLGMLATGMSRRGHAVTVLKPCAILSRIRMPLVVRKWLGYFDQYIIFPRLAKSRIKGSPANTLFVFTDHALGPWVRLVSDRPHVIHCHDFLAQRSARKEVLQNRIGWTGRAYQSMIRRGYTKGQNFICVSQQTRDDLHAFLTHDPARAEVIYNGLNQAFCPRDPVVARSVIGDHTGVDLSRGFILHVGGNQWYKNRRGVIEIYDEWRRGTHHALPLLMIGKKPDRELQRMHGRSPYRKDIYWIENLPDRFLAEAYSGATVLLFPSLAEGFGWPIAEAMACGCPVITTGVAPMTEVGGRAAFVIPPRPHDERMAAEWIDSSARVLNRIVTMNPEDRNQVVSMGLLNAKRFDTELSLNRIERVYKDIMGQFPGPSLNAIRVNAKADMFK